MKPPEQVKGEFVLEWLAEAVRAAVMKRLFPQLYPRRMPGG